MPDSNPLLIVISGPSGTGKGTICAELIRRQSGIVPSISCTTRAMRPGDREGATYFFKTEEQFEQMLAQDAFLEYARFYGHSYGTPREFVERTLESGFDCLLEIDPQGALQIMEKKPDAVSIYLMPPSMKELHRRLSGRATDSPEKIAMRFAASKQEMSNMYKYRYSVLNDRAMVCVDVIEAILTAERHASHRQGHLLDILEQNG